MTSPPRMSRRAVLRVAGAGAGLAALAACGKDEPKANGPQTIHWWHIATTEPLRSQWSNLAKSYQTANPSVKIEITTLENEAFKAKLTTVTQAGNPPDMFHTWGGGVLRQQLDAGLIKDLTDGTSSWINTLTPASVQPYQFDGKTYGIPFDVGMIGFWYNKELFARAGVTAPPTAWGDLLAAVGKLKATGITPIALAGKDKWPGHYYWAYLAMRVAGLPALQQAAVDKSFENPDFVTAGVRFKELIDLKPFQKGYLAAEYGSPDGQAATMGNGGAAMELMGQWAPAVQKDASNGKKGLGDKLGFFLFPAVDGGKGSPTDAFGGGGGHAVGKDAPPATVDFLKFISQVDNQRTMAAAGAVIPVAKGAEDAVKDANLKTIAQDLATATGFQLYLDQAYPPAVGQQVNDSVAQLIAGTKTPEQVTSDITKVAKEQ